MCCVLQGRLESLLNFQTMVADLTGMEMSQSSLLDEATAAAEAMTMTSAMAKGKKPRFLVAANCHPQTIEVCRSRADGLGLTVDVVPADKIEFAPDVCGALVQVRPIRGGRPPPLAHVLQDAVCLVAVAVTCIWVSGGLVCGIDSPVICAACFGRRLRNFRICVS